MNSTTKAALTFAFIAVLWIIAVVHGTLGFMRPDNAHNIFGDIVHFLVWLAFLYSGWNLIATVRARRT